MAVLERVAVLVVGRVGVPREVLGGGGGGVEGEWGLGLGRGGGGWGGPVW